MRVKHNAYVEFIASQSIPDCKYRCFYITLEACAKHQFAPKSSLGHPQLQKWACRPAARKSHAGLTQASRTAWIEMSFNFASLRTGQRYDLGVPPGTRTSHKPSGPPGGYPQAIRIVCFRMLSAGYPPACSKRPLNPKRSLARA
jgi:hypothetical protein